MGFLAAIWHGLAIVVVMLLIALATTSFMALPPEEPVDVLIQRYCLDCHESPGPKADLDLAAVLQDPDAVPPATWRDIEAHLIGRTMPPAKAKRRPGDAEYLELISWVSPHAGTPGSRRVTLRRLNAVEYGNTIRDLFDVDMDTNAFFPDDDVGYGFDTIGDVLTISPLLMERYLDAAEVIAMQAVMDPDSPVLPVVRAGGQSLSVDGAGRSTPTGVRMHSRATAHATLELPRAGSYRIRFGAWGDQAGDEPVRLAVHAGDRRLAVLDVHEERDDPAIRDIEATLPGGLVKVGVSFINDFYRPDHPDPGERDRNAVVQWIEVEGPLDEPIIGAFQSSLPPTTGDRDRWLRAVLDACLPLIWRGPVEDSDRDLLIELATAEPGSHEQGLRTALVGALVSPRFLYRLEMEPGDGLAALSPHELATRMSYFLWSSTPPRWLLDSADAGELDYPDGRAMAVDRLLADPRSRALSRNFATQWLQVRDLVSRRPDPDQFPGIDESLLVSMQEETIAFFDEILREDYDIDRLLDAQFTWINDELADHYGLPRPGGDTMQRVSLEGSGHRGGLLHHAGIMTATSNPTRTSIVKRGKWVLEALLDQPPPPPPPGLDGLPEDGGHTAASLRAQMELHRADPSCAACHIRMDALGFALENLDAVGRWRSDDKGLEIDASGQLPDGRVINGPDELRDVLLDDPALRRSLASHLLIFALGRGLAVEDDLVVTELVESLQDQPTMRGLIHGIVESDVFRLRTRNLDL